MNLYRSCPFCQKESHQIDFSDNRVDLAMKRGDEIEYTCSGCGERMAYPVDFLYRKPSRWIKLISILLFLLGVPVLFYLTTYHHLDGEQVTYFLSGLTVAPITVYLILKEGDKMRVARFNEHFFKTS